MKPSRTYIKLDRDVILVCSWKYNITVWKYNITVCFLKNIGKTVKYGRQCFKELSRTLFQIINSFPCEYLKVLKDARF